MSVEKTIIETIAYSVQISETMITHQTRLIEDLDMDSLDHFEMALQLEEELDISNIPDETIASFRTVGDMIKYMQWVVEKDHASVL